MSRLQELRPHGRNPRFQVADGFGALVHANLQAPGFTDIPFATQRSDNWRLDEVPLGVLGEDVELPISRGDRGKIVQALREQDKARRLREAELIIEKLGAEE